MKQFWSCMPGLARIAAAAIALLIHDVQSKRLRLRQDLFPTDVDSSFIQQEHASICLSRVDPTVGNASQHLSRGALVLTSERLLAYVPPMLPSCTPLDWKTLSTDYRRGQELMYIEGGVLEKARFETPGKFVFDQDLIFNESGDLDQFVWYTPLTPKPAPFQHVSQFELGKFYPINGKLLPPWSKTDCAYPQEAASIAIETIAMNRYVRPNETELGPSEPCFAIKGCPDDECKKNRVEWTACFAFREKLTTLNQAILDAHLKRNDIKEILGYAIEKAGLFARNRFLSPPTGSYFDISDAFIEGIIPQKEDPNSRSGAAFFYSSDQKYIAKRIRDAEFKDGLKALAQGGNYRLHHQKGSILCPTYIGFQSNGDNWIVMRKEQLAPEIKAIIHKQNLTGEKSFFADVKPHPMVSDRVKFHAMLGKEFLERGFKFADLNGWEDVIETAEADFKFLQASDLVDYSFWIYGTLFDLATTNQKEAFETSMYDVFGKMGSQRKYPGCAYGCQNPRPTALVDMTSRMGEDNRITVDDGLFKCCCAVVSATTFRHESPCVLASLDKETNERTLLFNRTGCGNLLGQGWHAWWRDLTPTKGKCLVGMGAWQLWAETPHIKDNIVLPDKLGYKEVWPDLVSGFPWRCGVVCVSIGDYFLHLGAWESFENVALTLWYQAQKWTDYPAKMARILQGISGSPPYGDDFVDAIDAGMPEAIAKRVKKDITNERYFNAFELR